MKHLDRLNEVDESYAYYHDDETDEPGSLVVESETGDTFLPPFEGRWAGLEAVDSREEAVEAARAREDAE